MKSHPNTNCVVQVESYPLFQGLEKHYLRAQIARISAATHISPRDYFAHGGNTTTSKKWRKLTIFQSKAMTKKGECLNGFCILFKQCALALVLNVTIKSMDTYNMIAKNTYVLWLLKCEHKNSS